MESIAVVIGEGLLPQLLISSIQSKGKQVFGIALQGVVDKQAVAACDDHVFLAITQIGKAIKECLRRGIRHVVFAGRVRHQVIFDLSLLKMDWTTLKIWNALKDRRTDSILNKIVEAFEKKGIRCLRQSEFLQDQMPAVSQNLSSSYPSSLIEEALFGFRLAKGLGSLDIGQSVVVKGFSAVAVEAIEGTNKCLRRAHDLAGEGCMLVKVSKPRQDFRFDVPIIGLQTIEILKEIRAKALVVEAERTLFLQKEQCLQLLNNLHIPLISLSSQQLQSI